MRMNNFYSVMQPSDNNCMYMYMYIIVLYIVNVHAR